MGESFLFRNSFLSVPRAVLRTAFAVCLNTFSLFFFAAKPASHNKWRSDKNDLSKIYDTATPNPTGSLSGPWFDLDFSGNVTGVVGKNTYLACRIKNLANQTVSMCLSRPLRKSCHLTTILPRGLENYWQLAVRVLCTKKTSVQGEKVLFLSWEFTLFINRPQFLQVTWIRHRDTHLLTAGLYSYTKDPRVSAIHRSNSEDWVLELRQTELQDAGTSDCTF